MEGGKIGTVTFWDDDVVGTAFYGSVVQQTSCTRLQYTMSQENYTTIGNDACG